MKGVNKVPTVPKAVGEHTREKVELLNLHETICEVIQDKTEIIKNIRKLSLVRNANLVTRPLLALLLGEDAIPQSGKLEDFSVEDAGIILIHIYEAVFYTPPKLKGAEYFETVVSPRLVYVTGCVLNSPVNKDTGVRASHIHTVNLGFESKADMDEMTTWLYSPDISSEYGIKLIGYRTGNRFRTQSSFEAKVWLSPDIPLEKQEELLTLIEGKLVQL